MPLNRAAALEILDREEMNWAHRRTLGFSRRPAQDRGTSRGHVVALPANVQLHSWLAAWVQMLRDAMAEVDSPKKPYSTSGNMPDTFNAWRTARGDRETPNAHQLPARARNST